jgi:osmotically-inducible protein OsmY
MNTEKIEKLKKSLSNTKIPADLKPKIEAEIKRLEDLDFDITPIALKNKLFLVGTAVSQNGKNRVLSYVSTKYQKYKLIDEIKAPKSSSPFSDVLMKAKIKAKLALTNGIRSGNYFIAVNGDEVFVAGYSEDNQEYSLTLEAISSTWGVKTVLNYIEIKNL